MDFGGIVKGMCLGDIAKIFFQNGIKNFVVNAGNGNMVFSGKYFYDKLKMPKGKKDLKYSSVFFLSQSAALQERNPKKTNHIKDIKKISSKEITTNYFVRILCVSEPDQYSLWDKVGAFSDVYSTTLIINPDIKLPKNCFRINR